MLDNHATAALLAAPEVVRAAWIEGLGTLLFVAFWLIRAVTSAIAEQKEAERLREARAQGDGLELDELELDGEPALAGRQADDPKQGDLRSEVEDFLKRVGEMGEPNAEAAEARAADARGMAPPLEDQPRRQTIDPFEEPVRRRRPVRQQPSEAIELLLETEDEIVPAPEPIRQRVELRHLPESQLAEQAAQMGGALSQTDERLEARLHDKFDHRLGKLEQRSESPPEAPPEESETGAARIKALLARPGGVREAVVLSEILRRPDDL